MTTIILDKNTKYYENIKYNEQFIEIMNGTGGAGHATFIGYVTNGQAMPINRIDGTPLQNEDYVRPLTSSTFPFTTTDNKCTFESDLSRAIYAKTIDKWIVDTGIIQSTEEIPLSSPSEESFSGLSLFQNQINIENVKELKTTIKQYKVLPTNYSQYIDTVALYVGNNGTYEKNHYYKCDGTGWYKFNIVPASTIEITNLTDSLKTQIYKVETSPSDPSGDVLILKSLG